MSLPLENETLDDVDRELTRAKAKHPPMRNAHEAYAVILEELDGAWELIKMQDGPSNSDFTNDRRAWRLGELRKELIQVAAMAVRAVDDLDLAREAAKAKVTVALDPRLPR